MRVQYFICVVCVLAAYLRIYTYTVRDARRAIRPLDGHYFLFIRRRERPERLIEFRVSYVLIRDEGGGSGGGVSAAVLLHGVEKFAKQRS